MIRKRFYFILLGVLLIALVLPGIASARSLQDDRILVGETFTLGSGEELDGNLVVFGGVITTEQGSRIIGDVVVLGGSVNIDGRVDGNLVTIGGTLRLGSNSWVRGNVTSVAGSFDRDANATIDGQLTTGSSIRIWETARIIVPDIPGSFDFRVSPSWDFIGLIFRTFLWAALAILVVLFLPVPTERVSRTIVAQPLLSGGVGLLTGIVAPLMLVVMMITLILIPVSLLGGFILIVTWFFGRIALGLEIGRRFANVLQKDLPLAVHSGIGTFILVLVVDGANMFIPCVGSVFSILVGLLGLGGVLLSRYGTQVYSPVSAAVISP
ncbi:MAG: hypothetical protein ACNA8H_05150, partial [Anaerolineales bacterium]